MSPQHVLVSNLGSTFYEDADNVRSMLEITGSDIYRLKFSHLEWPGYTWPGGYELHYYAKDGGVLCHQCANTELERTIDPDDLQFYTVGRDVNWESPHVMCDHCNRVIGPEHELEEDEA